ncbi:MAG TPA: dTMP kinase [Allosphingosinicella sp.]|nr:dTMP kinase [Allosphingosinicella sp.]
MRGKFISLEGGEGVGKSTQAKALEAALRERGIDVLETREPGGTPAADQIRALLLMGDEQRWTPRAEALLFAAARSDHVTHVIKPALERGTWVISDRFLDSSIAYQGGAGGLGFDMIRTLHDIGSEGILPDRTLLLDLPTDEADERAARRDLFNPDLIGRRGTDYHHKVAEAFRALADAEPDRFRVIDASGPPTQVTRSLFAAIEDLL